MRKVRAFVIFVVLIFGLVGVAAVVARGQAPLAQNAPPAASQNSSAGHGGELGFTDTPMLPGLPYHVHDPARPHPSVITPGAQNAPPSGAIVLFDGHDLSQWNKAHLLKDAEFHTTEPPAWKVENGYVEVVTGKEMVSSIMANGDIATKEKFGDVQLHIEWATPAEVKGNSQERGNSGVFLQGRFEIQVLDSYQNLTYADGQAAAIYGQTPPLENPSRKPGEWQTFDIVFEAPKFDGDTLVKPAYVTIIMNGVLVQNHREIIGPTVNRRLAKYVPQPAEDSLVLQNHNYPVRFRNIWIRRLHGYDEPEK